MLSLALALHDLATTEAKYGALSVEDGTVLITAQRSSDDRALITWEEENGPKVSPPGEDDSGFGVFLIERVLGSDLAGNVEIDYAESGVVCRIEFPLY